MRFNLYINQKFAIANDLNASQALLFGFLYNLHEWAELNVINGDEYYLASPSMIAAELPILTDKADTVYRLMKKIESCGLINMKRVGGKTFVQVTRKGQGWKKSDGEPSETPGNKSETPGNKSETPGNKSETPGNKSEYTRKNFRPLYKEDHINNDHRDSTPLPPKESPSPKQDFQLPDWLPPRAWRDFVEYRQEIKKPLGRKASELAIAKLDQLRRSGSDPQAVIEQTILNGWTRLIPIREERSTHETHYANRKLSAAEQAEQAEQRYYDRIERERAHEARDNSTLEENDGDPRPPLDVEFWSSHETGREPDEYSANVVRFTPPVYPGSDQGRTGAHGRNGRRLADPGEFH